MATTASAAFRGDEEVHLVPKAFDFLDFLLSHRPGVVSRERIRNRLWPGTFVSESTLATIVNDVRAALGDDPKRPRFIRTLRGRGYAFLAEAVSSASEAPRSGRRAVSFRLVTDDREVALHEGDNLLGRDDDAVLWIDAPRCPGVTPASWWRRAPRCSRTSAARTALTSRARG